METQLSVRFLRLASVALVLFVFAAAATAYEPTTRYELRDVEGYKVYIHKNLLPGGEHEETGAAAIKKLTYGLAKTRQMVAEPALSKLMAVKIWLEVDSTNGKHGRTSGYQYHPDLPWLVKMDFNPKKVKCVEYGNAASLAKRSLLKTTTVTMHELAHAYHNQVIGFDHPDVFAAHKRAQTEGKYPERDWVVRANHKEFFAGLVTRYYGTAEERKALVERDPVFARKLEEWFGKPKAFVHTPIDPDKAESDTKAESRTQASASSSTFLFIDDTKRG